jgi:hypothetical protein
MQEHREVLIAIAEGKEVQYKSLSLEDWTTMEKNSSCNPISAYKAEWRVKPNPAAEKYSYWYSRDSNSKINDKRVIWKAAFEAGVESNEKLNELKNQIKTIQNAMQTFVNRVDCGEITSFRTYNEFKELLKI